MPKKNEQSAAITSPDVRREIIEKIRAAYPPLFSDEGNLNKAELEALLKDFEVNDVAKFEFRWAGKMGSKKTAFTPSKARLQADPKRSVNFDDTQNAIIEGENLEVLKLLQKAYYGQVKCIYIDPPYNSDGDFVYSDDYSEDRKAYWEQSGTTEGGVQIDTNTEASGRYHSDWLCMMQSRLLLAHRLLKDEGVVFVSIDEHEAHNLRKVMDEVFGPENFVVQFVWFGGKKNDSRFVSVSHEYVLCYVKDLATMREKDVTWRQKKRGLDEIYATYDKLKKKFKDDFGKIEDGLSEWYSSLPIAHPAKMHSHYSNVDGRGIYFPDNISWPGGGGPKYDVLHPVTKKPCAVPSRGWMFAKPERMQEIIDDDRVHFGPDETNVPCIKSYLKDREMGVPYSIFYQDGRAATKRLRALMGGDYFDHPKDEMVLKDLLEFTTSGDDIVMDFFAGSGTTAHSVMLLNAQDKGKRRFVLVQIPQETAEDSLAHKAGYKKISQITFERVKRAGAAVKTEYPALDSGYKAFTLTGSLIPENLFVPDAKKSDKENLAALDLHIAKSKQKLIADYDETDLLYEVMLKDGFDLNFKAERLTDFTKNQILKVTDRNSAALVCLDHALKDETVKALEAHKGLRFICLHRAVDTTKKWGLDKIFGDSLSLI